MKFQFSNNLLGLLFIIFVFIILHIPTISNPYHYDAVVWVAQSKYLLENGPFARPPQDFGHPYFMFWILALAYKFFGESVIVSHSIMLLFSAITIAMTYLIGKELFNEKIGLVAAAFLSFQPWFFTVTGWVYFDIPLTALFSVSMYSFIKSFKSKNVKYYLLFALFGSMAALTKTPGILVSLIPLVYFAIQRKFKSEYLIFLIPAFVLMSWMIWHFMVSGYFFDPKVEGGVLFPTSLKNISLIARTYTTNIFFNFIQNGNFIAFLLMTYLIFYKKYEKIYLILIALFLIFGNYSFLLFEPDVKFYLFLLLFDIIFLFWVLRIPKLKNEYKFLVIWIAVVMLHSFYIQLSFRYGFPFLPAYSILFASAILQIKQRDLKGIILIVVFGLFVLQIINFANYYTNRDTIFMHVFDYFRDKIPQNVMVHYPLAVPDLIEVKEIDSRPWRGINLSLTPETKEEFEKINPQYLVVDERSTQFDYPYIQEIVRDKEPEIVYSKEINWYTYFGVRKVFVNRLYIYKFY